MEVLHREEVLAARLADVVDLDDVRVVQVRGEPRLVEEHVDEALILRVFGADPLQHHVALEPLDPIRPCEQHVGHTARRQVLEHDIPSQPFRHLDAVSLGEW